MNQNHRSEPDPQAAAAQDTGARQARQPYQAPRLSPLGEWTALTLANSVPTDMSLPPFFK